MRRFNLSTTLTGTITDKDTEKAEFRIKCRSGDEFLVSVGSETQFVFLQNLDGVSRDRVSTPEGYSGTPSDRIDKYIQRDRLVVLQGIYQEDNDKKRFDARVVNLLQDHNGEFLFEKTHWWLTQIARLADTWLDDLFPNKQTYSIDDFALYQTNLNIIGLPEDNNAQECATLSRLIYGLSSAYLLTGCERYLSAASAGVQYQRETFRSLSHEGKHCFWAYGKRKTKYGYELYVRSQNGDDYDTIPLYEQIYALAGLAQYYRITLDWEVLDDIKRTVRTFNDFFLDPESEYGVNAYGDYFSHLDYVTMTWDSEALGDNRAKKNWNSIGDHIPAYLINVILAIEPLPIAEEGFEDIQQFLDTCKKILNTTSRIIVDKFADSDPNIPFVNERFLRDWKPDQTWRWQQDRAVVGHNLKIAWNLTRVANYYYYQAAKSKQQNPLASTKDTQLPDRLMRLADRLGITMSEAGFDLFRGGIFDALERHPSNGMPTEFTWGNTKDFWQQEQALLAYLILCGCSHENDAQKREYLKLAQETATFWNLFFLDRDNKGVFFRVNDSGIPMIQGNYGNKGGHSISGYHAFELNYLAHIYTSIYVNQQPFCLYFKPNKNCRQHSINVLPDFVKADTLEVSHVSIDGSERTTIQPNNFRIELGKFCLGSEPEIIVQFKPLDK
jgi:mannose/cellobiose epimerase-like protein (N-acyl-D-glucosamine 2-epimerase family)